MKLSFVGRWSMALFASLALGLGMTACGGGTVGYMWVLGQEYNQIAGFKVDEYSGNLTEVPNSPFASNGSVPVSIAIKTGGRYVYIINQGVCPTAGCGTAPNVGQFIALYSVGGDGTLVFQQKYQSQGYYSMWAQMDASGTYLFVLDKYAPGLNAQTGLYNQPSPGLSTNSTVGSITVFSTDPNTGRLTLITNSQTQVGGVNTPFWEVGPAPIMSQSQGGCLYTVNSGLTNGLQTVTPFSIGSSGQLGFTTTGNIPINQVNGKPTDITSINGSGSLMFLTDGANNILYGYQTGGSCGLSALSGGTTNLGASNFFPNTSNPSYSMLDSTGLHLYIVNNSTTSTQITTPYSSISALSYNPANQELQPIIGAPYPVGSGPVCIVEDPTHQYIYTSNYNDGTVTGYQLNPGTGELSDLSKGSTFTATGKASCLAISGAVE
jgi:6-phosphogluconolactonase (cycloisomerase 2 family)